MNTLISHLLAIMPAFVQMSGACALLPIGDGIHAYAMRASIALALSVGMYSNTPTDYSMVTLAGSFMGGMVATLPLVLMLHAASGIGEVVETGRGMTIGQIIDPQYELSELPFAQICRWGMLAYLASSGIFERALVQAMNFSAVSISNQDLHSASLALFAVLTHLMFVSLSAAFPLLALYLTVELTGAMMSKVLPGLSLSSEIFIVKAAGICVITLLLAGIGIEPQVLALYESFTNQLVLPTL